MEPTFARDERTRTLIASVSRALTGLSGEIAATITEHDPALLTHFGRVCVPDVPIPYARELEYAVLPTAARIEAAVRTAAAA